MSLVDRGDLKVDELLARFVEDEALPGTPVKANQFWSGLAALVREHAPRNVNLLRIRDELQTAIDGWHRAHGPAAADHAAYEAFLREIGYIVPEPADFQIETTGLDPEITTLCGPQLVVPVSNPRYALNAANARWGSLYDALYGSDAIARDGELAPGKGYNPKRGAAVVKRAAEFLDQAFPLHKGSHSEVTAYKVVVMGGIATLVIEVGSTVTTLRDKTQFVGYREEPDGADILLRHHGLHVELDIDRTSPVGKVHPAGLKDVIVEAALTTIQDCEDSVAAVDAEDKVGVYRNWLGLMTGTLADTFEKAGMTVDRKLNPDREYSSANGGGLTLKGRALLLCRNVGHLMTTDMVASPNGVPVGEGLIDAAVTALCALHDHGRNSATGAIYIVKPKMHGPDEVGFACDVFASVEEMLGIQPLTIKIGIMDEERRTSANLKASVHAARERVFFINTGFLDRTGDEIHTSMEAGPVLRKDAIKAERWLQAYEDRNVMIGLHAGFTGKAQIGKGMWARPDDMAEMMRTKIAHPQQGANTAWVPSPTAATLHALHYHQVDVFEAQKRRHNQPTPSLGELFSMPALVPDALPPEAILRELDLNAQSILGYVVRWIDQGVGCSKVPDINDVALMEDRATLRISSQAIANWLRHGIATKEQVETAFRRMAAVVDTQNAGDPIYRPMAPAYDGIAFRAALDLALMGASQPSGYTEPILHARRKTAKAAARPG